LFTLKIVVSTLEKTERIFQSEAATLLHTVTQTISDINELHAKIGTLFLMSKKLFVFFESNKVSLTEFLLLERKNDLDQKNLQTAQEFKQTTEGQVHSSELYVKDFIAQQTKRYNTLHNDIVTFVQQKDKVSSC
jgi:hypothetical protein